MSQHAIIDFDQGFFEGNPLLHPELPYHAQGFSATPVPYGMWHDDVVTGGLILCLVILICAYNQVPNQIRQQSSDFFSRPKERIGLFAEETSIGNRPRLLLVLQLCLTGSLAMLAYMHFVQGTYPVFPLDWKFTLKLLAIYVACFLAFFVAKRILSSFINWIFFPKYQQRAWFDLSSFIFFAESILFFPILLGLTYLRIPPEKVSFAFLFILLSVKIILTFKTYQIFFHKSYCLLHLFVYLCALEIMPLLALLRVMATIAENVVVKY